MTSRITAKPRPRAERASRQLNRYDPSNLSSHLHQGERFVQCCRRRSRGNFPRNSFNCAPAPPPCTPGAPRRPGTCRCRTGRSTRREGVGGEELDDRPAEREREGSKASGLGNLIADPHRGVEGGGRVLRRPMLYMRDSTSTRSPCSASRHTSLESAFIPFPEPTDGRCVPAPVLAARGERRRDPQPDLLHRPRHQSHRSRVAGRGDDRLSPSSCTRGRRPHYRAGRGGACHRLLHRDDAERDHRCLHRAVPSTRGNRAPARQQDLRPGLSPRARAAAQHGRQRLRRVRALRGAERALPDHAPADVEGRSSARSSTGSPAPPRAWCKPGWTAWRWWRATATCRPSFSTRAST